jgi:hypothetical protein
MRLKDLLSNPWLSQTSVVWSLFHGLFTNHEQTFISIFENDNVDTFSFYMYTTSIHVQHRWPPSVNIHAKNHVSKTWYSWFWVQLKFFCFLKSICFFLKTTLTVQKVLWGKKKRSVKRTKQSEITSMVFPLLQKSTVICLDRQINVPGSFWIVNKGHMSDEEVNLLYKCSVHEHHVLTVLHSGMEVVNPLKQ